MTSILKVSEIQDPTNSNTALTIDSSGRITKPQQIAFLASSSGTTHTTNIGNVLDFGVVVINKGNHYNSTTYTFTAPVAGLYNFYWQVYEQNGTGVKQVALQKNGSDYSVYDTAITAQGAVNIGDHTMPAALLMDLAVNDTIRIAVRATASHNLQWYGGHSWFQGYFIG